MTSTNPVSTRKSRDIKDRAAQRRVSFMPLAWLRTRTEALNLCDCTVPATTAGAIDYGIAI